VAQFQHHERLAGVAVYDAQRQPLAFTAGLEEMQAAGAGALRRALQPGGGSGAFFPWEGRTMHVAALPIAGDAGLAGMIEIFQDAGYIDAQEISLWRRTLAGVAVQTLMIVGATLLFLRWSLRRPLARLEKWLGDLRRGAAPEGPDLPEEPDFARLKRAAARVATTLTAARAAAQEEARLRDAGETLWTEERLRAFIGTRLEGSRLFVVSNREPYEHVRRGGAVECSVPASGLVTALEPILRASDGTWIAQGTGDADRETADERGHVRVQYTLRRVWLTTEKTDSISDSPTKGCGRSVISRTRGRFFARRTGSSIAPSTSVSPTRYWKRSPAKRTPWCWRRITILHCSPE